MSGEPIAERRFLVPDAYLALTEEWLQASVPTGHVLVSRPDGDAELALYLGPDDCRRLDRELCDMARRWQWQELGDREQELAVWLASCRGGGPVQLCQGVWLIDEGGESVAGELCLRLRTSVAFGDGLHPSTTLAAGLMPQALAGLRVWDLGCGTGVLGLLAACRGATVGFSDVAEEAMTATRINCALNQVRPTHCLVGDLLAGMPAEPIDLLLANLYGDLLPDLFTDPLLDLVLPQGEVIVSGIAAQRRGQVLQAATQAGFDVLVEEQASWWHAARLRR